MEAEKEIAVKVDKLRKKYYGDQVLKGVTLEIEAGKVTALVGPNGSGKSTALKVMAGLIRPSSGKVRALGKKPGRKLNNELAFFPEKNHLYNWMSIEKAITFFNRQYSNFDLDKAEGIMYFMNLDPRLKISNLSRGLLARVKMVLTLARRAPLLIMDEPLAGIDPQSRAKILKSLDNECQSGEKTIILSTHEVFEAEKLFNYVFFMEDGKVKIEGSADELRAQYQESIQDLAEEVFK
ncbi:ABC transporter ATP-binding protein [Fuchsiella alkaliacetigena]|uniref:ABC transporter ATP-binding protein n=1 Tax=Fuchsiella alkaliacetigena TaxID=957042 RepID=UPI00200A7452|nr:ABC transporter ATP-binding protein [Fuchsiella alkaliacetigena]MCK8825416.1 ABC transporter ATP-binding protein [Fuchsiella alkaliacetigena]